MFRDFLVKWLMFRYVQQSAETRTFRRSEVETIPEGYYAVVKVELKPIADETSIAYAEPTITGVPA